MLKRICWVTTDWFVDVDLPVIPILLAKYSINWIVILYKGGRFKERDFNNLRKLENLSIEFIHVNQIARHPKTLIDYFLLYRTVKQYKADLVYFNMPPGSPYIIIPYCLLKKNNTIYTAHDGSIKSIMSRATKITFRIGYGWHSRYVHMFSLSQAKEFHVNYPGKDVSVIPLMPKDYGSPSESARVIDHTFLSFGSMHREKNIGLLIQAAESLYEDGVTGFRVSICGQPVDWEKEYAPFIKHPQLFNLQLRMIDNTEIPDLFASHQFVVYPYKVMSQSGALKVAYAYKKPVITSDLPAFKEEVKDGTNGFFFHSDDMESLKKVMLRCINMSERDYAMLLKNVSDYIKLNYSKPVIRDAYSNMFDKILKQ